METKEAIKDIRAKILKGLDITHQKLIEMKRKNNGVLVVSEKGRIIRIKP